ncbi:MAG: hypothetical protein WD942_04650, partial [Dehalococcoidia bacterium]
MTPEPIEQGRGRRLVLGVKATTQTKTNPSVALQADVPIPDRVIVLQLDPDDGYTPRLIDDGSGHDVYAAAGKAAKNGQRKISFASLRSLPGGMISES